MLRHRIAGWDFYTPMALYPHIPPAAVGKLNVQVLGIEPEHRHEHWSGRPVRSRAICRRVCHVVRNHFTATSTGRLVIPFDLGGLAEMAT